MNFLLKEYLQELEYLVNIDSGSWDAEGTAKIADYFKKKFTDIGWSVKKHQFDEAVGPCLEITNGDTQQFDILLIGHMDTVFTKGTAAARPFCIRDNKAYGPGVNDMKASLLSLYYAIKDLDEAGILDKASICVAMNSDEEISSRYSTPWIRTLAKKSRYAIVVEPARIDGTMVNKRRGVGRYYIEFTGVASHTGVSPEKGISAINEMANWTVALHGLTNLAAGTNLNVGVVSGGTTANTVAEKCNIEVDLRISDLAEAERVDNAIRELLANPKTPGIKVSVKGGVTRPPMNPTPEALDLCKAVEKIGKELGVDVIFKATGGASDANTTGALGVPSLDGLGPIGGYAHTANEYLDIESVKPRLELLRGTIEYIVRSR